MTPQRRESDRQDIRVLPLSGALVDVNAVRALEQSWSSRLPKPAYVARLSLDDEFCKAVEAESRERAA